ncbi:MAG: histidine phosphatase family protein [Firmicutes bacterium]|nr:histidine phosphatase family protein [Bacillota bacterium]
MGTRIIFVRHGETVWNQEQRYQGQADSPLSDLGMVQAEQVGRYLSRGKVDAVYTSDLRRALLTAQQIAKYHGLEPIADQRLREMSFGIWEGLTRKEVQEKYPDLFYARFQDNLTNRVPGGELPGEVVQRMHSFLEERIQEHDGQTIVLVSHGGTLRTIISSLLHMPLEKSYCLQQSNAGVSEFLYNRQGSSCPWQAVTINSTAHLS